jgi:hypothetical protein
MLQKITSMSFKIKYFCRRGGVYYLQMGRTKANPGAVGTYVPSNLLTSTMTPNFDRWSQRIKKIVGASRLKKDTLSLKLLSLKYILKCPKKFKMVVNLCFLHFSLCWFQPVEIRNQKCVFMLYFFLKMV